MNMAKGCIGKPGLGKLFPVDGNMPFVTAVGKKNVEFAVSGSRETVVKRFGDLPRMVAEAVDHSVKGGE